MLWEHEVVGSNPAAPTTNNLEYTMKRKVTQLGNVINHTINPQTRRYLQSRHYQNYGYYHKETFIPGVNIPDFLLMGWDVTVVRPVKRQHSKGKRRSGRQKQK